MLNNDEHTLFVLDELRQMFEGMENSCVLSVAKEIENEDKKAWTTLGVLAAFSSMRQTMEYLKLTIAASIQNKNELN